MNWQSDAEMLELISYQFIYAILSGKTTSFFLVIYLLCFSLYFYYNDVMDSIYNNLHLASFIRSICSLVSGFLE